MIPIAKKSGRTVLGVKMGLKPRALASCVLASASRRFGMLMRLEGERGELTARL
jgi:hypothetical protein